MVSKRTEILSKLLAYRHGFHTDLSKGTLNNRDACALILWTLGPTPMREIMSILREWRGPVKGWNGRPSALHFTYLFNSSRSGGYGCVADEPMQRGWHMSREWSGIIGRPGTSKDYDPKDTFFRRTYWYRLNKGIYAPTVECGKRMMELNFMN